MKFVVKDCMTELPHTIGHDMPLTKARAMMKEYRCHHLPVLDGGKLVGVISDRDLGLLEIANGEDVTVEELMTDEPVVVEPSANVKAVAEEMLKKKVGSAIVRATPGGKWGIFTTTDALKILAKVL